MRNEDGFTLVEMLVAMALTVILMSLSASAFRQYWLTRSVTTAQDQTVTQLRHLQARVVSESHPLVFGARFEPGSSSYSVIEYQPAIPGSPVVPERCTATDQSFETGVIVQSASFSNASGISSFCSTALGAPASEFVFFFARGTATEGNLVLEQPALEGRTRAINIKPITGRVQAVAP